MNWLGKVAYYLTYPGLMLMSRTFSKQRVRVQIRTPAGEILLVKTWFGRQRWSLPGGGIEDGETAEDAAVRELREETGIITDVSSLTYLGDLKGKDGLPFNLRVFALEVDKPTLPALQAPYKYEIIGRVWTKPNDLPLHCSQVVQWAIDRTELPITV